MIWNQSYYLFGQGIVVSALIAAVPLFVALFLLGVLRKPAWVAGTSGLAATLVLAIAVYKMPVGLAVSAAAYGAAFGLFPISWIVLWAIVLFRLTVETGKFDIIKGSIGRLTDDSRLQALLIAFGFGAFIEGAAGFGTPVAIAGAMMVGLGFSPLRAAGICLLANTAPVAFGSIGIPVITLAGITGLPLKELSTMVGWMCAPIALVVPCYLILAMGGKVALRAVWKHALVAGGTFAVAQFVVLKFIGPELTDILASIAAMAALIAASKLWKTSSQTMEAQAAFRGSMAGEIAEEKATAEHHTTKEVLMAWLPYGFLVLCVLLWGFPPFKALLEKATISVAWPGLHNLVMRMPPIVGKPSPYAAKFALNFLSASGTSCMVATLLSAIALGVGPGRFIGIFGKVCKQLIPPTTTIASVLALAFLMNYCGATVTMGLAFAATSTLFPFFSALLGWLGVFLTGSDTSANALFGNLQVVTAGRLGLNPVLMAAANSAGGVMGKMISLQNIAVAAAATSMASSEQSKLFRFTVKHSVFLACVVGLLAMFYAYVMHM